MNHFVVELTYDVSPERIGELVADHRTFLQTGYDRGWLLFSGPQNPKTGGMIIARAPSLSELQAFFANDPYLLNKAASYRYVEFMPVKNQPFLADWIKPA